METVPVNPDRLAQLEAYARQRGKSAADVLDEALARCLAAENQYHALDWSQCPAVESIPGKVSGAWVFKNSRTPVSVIFENLEDGMTIDEVMDQFPVSRAQIQAVLEFAARSLDASARALMLILFDNGTPRGIARELQSHTVKEARDQGWDTLNNGALLEAAEAAGFDVLLTTDRNIRYQQNLTGRRIAIVVLGKGRWRLIKAAVPAVIEAVQAARPGSYTEVDIPD